MKGSEYSIKNAFIEAEIREFRAYGEDLLWEPSEKFETDMEKLIRAQKKPLWKYSNTVGKRAAIILVSLSVLFCSAMSVRAIREPVMGFFVEVFEKFTSMFSAGDLPKETGPAFIETQYTLFPAPDGYAVTDVSNGFFSRQTDYKNGDGNVLWFLQETVSNLHMTVNTEEGPYEQITVGGNEGIFYTTGDMNVLMWRMDGYLFGLYSDGGFDKEGLMLIAENVKPEKDAGD